MYQTIKTFQRPVDTTILKQADLIKWLEQLYHPQLHLTQSPSEDTKHSKGFYRTRTIHTDADQLMNTWREKYRTRHLVSHMAQLRRCRDLIAALKEQHPEPLCEMYYTFHIPKASGGMRRIDAPELYLKEVMSEIKDIFEKQLGVQYHDTCYSYFPGRSPKDALMVHQEHHSHWFAKFDMKDFFPNTTKEFLKQQLQQLYPFTFLYQLREAAVILDDILDLSILNGGLPQGTPLSPMLTNLMMVPIDFQLAQLAAASGLRYTRYADDMLFSGRQEFSCEDLQQTVIRVLQENHTPFTLNTTKTRYGSRAGSNWNLGLMLNKDNRITIGHREKQRIRATVNNFLRDFRAGEVWPPEHVSQMLGHLSYLRNTEPGYADFIVQRLERRHAVNFKVCVKRALNP